MLARGAAAEIVAGDDDLGVAIGGLVENEIGLFAPILIVAHLGEQRRAEPGALDGLEILLGDDHVGIDIDDRHGRGDARQCRELVHDNFSHKTPDRTNRTRRYVHAVSTANPSSCQAGWPQ